LQQERIDYDPTTRHESYETRNKDLQSIIQEESDKATA